MTQEIEIEQQKNMVNLMRHAQHGDEKAIEKLFKRLDYALQEIP